MLHIHKFTFNPFQENTYIISNDDAQCWIVDPGMIDKYEEQEFLQFITKNDLKPQAIINTHAHIDHILGVDFVANHFKIPFYIHKKELAILNNAANTAQMFGFRYGGVKTEVQFISEDQLYFLGVEEVQIRLVPGHSPGSIAFYSDKYKWVISGDALFEGSIGRTDLPMGNHETLLKSIRTQLFTLPNETIVYSGHGNPTIIAHEIATNPFLQ